MLLDPRNGPDWDLTCGAGPRRVYVVASTPRTGSTLLCRSLWDTGLVGAPKEYLNPMQLRDWEVRMGSPASAWRHRMLSGLGLAAIGRSGWSDDRIDAHLTRVMARRTGPTGWFGMKLHAHHHRQWFGARDLAEVLGPIRWVRIVRNDRLAQAVSWERALQSGRWAAHQDAAVGLPLRYSRTALERRLAAIARDEAWWDAVLADEDVLTLSYERLRGARAPAVRAILSWLGVDGAEGIGLHDAPLVRQADALNADWMHRFQRGA